MSMLSLQNIAIHYNKVPAVHNVSLQVNAGEIVALVGGNGNGKSSTLRAIAGLNPLARGAIVLTARTSPRCRRISAPDWACRWCRKGAACFPS